MRREPLDAQRRVLGPEHPSTLNTINNLASSLHGQGKWRRSRCSASCSTCGDGCLDRSIRKRWLPLTASPTALRASVGRVRRRIRIPMCPQLSGRGDDMSTRAGQPAGATRRSCFDSQNIGAFQVVAGSMVWQAPADESTSTSRPVGTKLKCPQTSPVFLHENRHEVRCDAVTSTGP